MTISCENDEFDVIKDLVDSMERKYGVDIETPFIELIKNELEKNMTIREKLSEIKSVQGYKDEIKEILEKIIYDTYDCHIDDVQDFRVGDTDIEVDYRYTCRGEHGGEGVDIPIEWLDEGFDYREAHRKMLREAERRERRAEAQRKYRAKKTKEKRKQLKKKTEEREYKTYLRLKEKFDKNQGEKQ